MNNSKTGLINYLKNEETKKLMVKTIADNIRFIKQIPSREALLDYAISIYNCFFRECILHNQYYTFSEKQYGRIKKMYEQLIVNLGNINQQSNDYAVIEHIVLKHREALLGALNEIGDADTQHSDIRKVCSEYSIDLQKSILRYNFDDLAEPILDIGCGENAYFITECIRNGKRCTGIDQYISKEYSNTILCRNWLEFEYTSSFWGTIISHMAFTNHFIYHLKHRTTVLEEYEKTYFKILNSLKSSGTWYYSPSIPEMEERIDAAEFAVQHIAENWKGIRVTAAQIKRR